MKKSLLTPLALFLFMQLSAQENVERISKLKGTSTNTSYLIAGVETSTTAYINTKSNDSSGTAPYVSFYANYHNKNHLGVSAKTYVLPGGSNSGFYLTSLSAYYANYESKIIPFLSYTRHIQTTNPSIPYSPIQNEVLAQLRITSNIIEPVFGFDWGFGNDKENNNKTVYDVNAFAGISHNFFLLPNEKNSMLAIVPTLQLNAGTDQYYSFLQTAKYVSRNRSVNYLTHGNNSGGNRGGNMNSGTITETVINQTNEFSLSNIEANFYLVFITGKFSIAPSGSLYFPLRGEDKTMYGYWQLNLNFTIE
ncbi:MAG TPA: hypothetical protein VLS85_14260 [Hanamia sp.]|nr:hypothetical protein [Hanamia sp.]